VHIVLSRCLEGKANPLMSFLPCSYVISTRLENSLISRFRVFKAARSASANNCDSYGVVVKTRTFLGRFIYQTWIAMWKVN
jgi:hypothetical protein